MTNKEKYINSFSGVEPSEEIRERIFNMTSTKKRSAFKTVIVVAAVILLISIVMFSVNAATGGELGAKISEAGKEISEKIIILFNDEEIAIDAEKTIITDENGEEVVSISFNLPETEGAETEDKIKIAMEYILSDNTDIDAFNFAIAEEKENGEVNAIVYHMPSESTDAK